MVAGSWLASIVLILVLQLLCPRTKYIPTRHEVTVNFKNGGGELHQTVTIGELKSSKENKGMYI